MKTHIRVQSSTGKTAAAKGTRGKTPSVRSTDAVPPQVRSEIVERARRRIVSGFYESDVCLDITVRRLIRDLRRPARHTPIIAPGRSAERRRQSGS